LKRKRRGERRRGGSGGWKRKWLRIRRQCVYGDAPKEYLKVFKI